MRLLQTIHFYTMVIISSVATAAPWTPLTPGRPTISTEQVEEGPDDALLHQKKERLQYQAGIGFLGGQILLAGESHNQILYDFRLDYREDVHRHTFVDLALTNKSHFLIEAGVLNYFDEISIWGDYSKYSLGTLLVPAEGISTFGSLNRVQFHAGLGKRNLFGSKAILEGSVSYALIGFAFEMRLLYQIH